MKKINKAKWGRMVLQEGVYFWFKEVMDLSAYVTQQVKKGKATDTYTVSMAALEHAVGPSFKNIKGLKAAQKIGDGLLRDYLLKCIKILG